MKLFPDKEAVMASIIYFKQAREDGGVRTGVELDELTYFETFENEAAEPDPTLQWWMDIRCKIDAPIHAPEEARRWLLDHAEFIKSGSKQLAEKLSAGVDRDYWPLQWEIPNPPPGVRARIVCSVSRRITGREISKVLLQVADRWEQEIRTLPTSQAVALEKGA
jgi:hypothetical protein